MSYDKMALALRAGEARKKAYSPYSSFCVGAALLCTDGTVYEGANIENSSYGATNCAERTAFFRAIMDGKIEFTAIAVVGAKRGEGKHSNRCRGPCRKRRGCRGAPWASDRTHRPYRCCRCPPC